VTAEKKEPVHPVEHPLQEKKTGGVVNREIISGSGDPTELDKAKLPMDGNIPAPGPSGTPAPGRTPSGPVSPVLPPDNGNRLITIQLGALRSLASAQTMIANLTKKGCRCLFIVRTGNGPNPFYKIRIGRFPTRVEADEAVLEVARNFGIKAITIFQDPSTVILYRTDQDCPSLAGLFPCPGAGDSAVPRAGASHGSTPVNEYGETGRKELFDRQSPGTGTAMAVRTPGN
jgi:hypothetical protein